MLRAGADSIERLVLPNGLTAIVDTAPHFSSAAISCSLVGGSRDETLQDSGINHLLEHLLFKRTTTKDLRTIAEQIDLFGGDVNAYTDPESISLHGTVPGTRNEELLEFLADLLLNAQFTEHDFNVEREIILQEIADMEDSADERTYQQFRNTFWANSSLGLPIAGTPETLAAVTLGQARQHLDKVRVGKRLVIAAAGNVDSDHFFRRVEALFGGLPQGSAAIRTVDKTSTGVHLVPHPSQQSYLLIGKPFPGSADDNYLHAVLFASILGQGSSSKLFQSLRERDGLCYEVDSSVEAYGDQGALLISSSFQPEMTERCMRVLHDEIQSFFDQGQTQRLLDIHRQMILSQLSMEDDSIRARVWRAVETELSTGRYIPAGEIADRMAQISVESLGAFANRYVFDTKNSVIVLGGDVSGATESSLASLWPY